MSSSRKISALIINQLMRNLHSEAGDEPVTCCFDDILVDSCYRDNDHGTLDWDCLEDLLGREDEEDTPKHYYPINVNVLVCKRKNGNQ